MGSAGGVGIGGMVGPPVGPPGALGESVGHAVGDGAADGVAVGAGDPDGTADGAAEGVADAPGVGDATAVGDPFVTAFSGASSARMSAPVLSVMTSSMRAADASSGKVSGPLNAAVSYSNFGELSESLTFSSNDKVHGPFVCVPFGAMVMTLPPHVVIETGKFVGS